ncbi:MAG: hypothetical protein ACOWWM_01735 [Desulfobacterales bacterium]
MSAPTRPGHQMAMMAAFTGLIIGMPLFGLVTTRRPLAPYLQFPPLTRHVVHEGFSWTIFFIYAAIEAAIVAVLLSAARRTVPGAGKPPRPVHHSFPWWGWAGLMLGGASWVLAWTRFEWFAPLQPHTFVPLWLSYILVVNGLCRRRSGSCPMIRRPLFFLFLFPLSALFWWYFEFLNRFVQNWWYTGVQFGPARYTLYASLSFSTVLPAVLSTREWIGGLAAIRNRFHDLPPVRWEHGGAIAFAVLAVAAASLFGIGLYPNLLFPLLWISPLLILVSLQSLAGQRHVFSQMAAGDWRPAVSAALAGLVCGFFWELWNIFSLAKWVYTIPYVQRFHLFEMPVLGYMGYLPFGLECLSVAGWIEPNFQRRRHGIGG